MLHADCPSNRFSYTSECNLLRVDSYTLVKMKVSVIPCIGSIIFNTSFSQKITELSGDKLVTKGTYAKMARGEMVRFRICI